MNIDTRHKDTSMLVEDWKEVLISEDAEKNEDPIKMSVTARLLENQDAWQELTESPANVTGDGTGNKAVTNWDPIMISMIRRAVPKMIAFDIFGVQPMTGPTGLIFAMKSHYIDAAARAGTIKDGTEALHNEPNSGWSGQRDDLTVAGDIPGAAGTSAPTWEGKGTPDGNLTDPTNANYGYGVGMEVADLEDMGDANVWNEMGFSIERAVVTAQSRALRTTWSHELTQDLKAVHGLDAETELSTMLSTEILNEINREMVRRAYVMSQNGATAGVFDLNTDSDGRWAVEKFKGLIFQLEKEANQIAFDTRRGKGNYIICSANVATAMAMTGLLDTGGKGRTYLTGTVDTTGTALVGSLNGRTKVFVDPYVTVEFVHIGYKGVTSYDSGAFYAPYVPLTMYRAQTEDGFQPRLGFKTRYGFTGHPFAAVSTAGSLTALSPANNRYYRIFKVNNL